MSSRDIVRRLGETRSGGNTKPGRQTMIAHPSLPKKDNLLRDAAAMAVDFSKFDCLSSQNHGEPLCEPVCVCGFEKILFSWTIDRFWRPDSSSNGLNWETIYKLVHSRMVLLFFVKTFLTALVTVQEI